MNLQRAAEAIGVTRRTIYNWMTWGYLPYTQSQPWRRHVDLETVRLIKRRHYRRSRLKAPRL